MEPKLALEPIGKLLEGSWQIYKAKFVVFLEIILLPAAFLLAGSLTIASRTTLGVILGWTIILVGVVIGVMAGFATLLEVVEGNGFVKSYERVSDFFWPLFWVGLLAGFITLGGFVMLFIPAILMGVWFSLSQYIVVAEGKRGLQVLSESRDYVRGYWWAMMGRLILMVLIQVIIVVIFDIIASIIFRSAAYNSLVSDFLNLVISPFSAIYVYLIYKNFVALKPDILKSQTVTHRGFFITSGIVGLVSPVIIIALLILFSAKLATFFSSSTFSGELRKIEMLESQGKYQNSLDSASVLLNKASTDKEKAAALYWIGTDYSHLGNIQMAQQEEFLAIKLDPNYGGPYITLAGLALADNDCSQALTYAQAAIKINDGYSAWGHNEVGLAYACLGDNGQATSELQKAIALDPGNYAFQANLRMVQQNLVMVKGTQRVYQDPKGAFSVYYPAAFTVNTSTYGIQTGYNDFQLAEFDASPYSGFPLGYNINGVINFIFVGYSKIDQASCNALVTSGRASPVLVGNVTWHENSKLSTDLGQTTANLYYDTFQIYASNICWRFTFTWTASKNGLPSQSDANQFERSILDSFQVLDVSALK